MISFLRISSILARLAARAVLSMIGLPTFRKMRLMPNTSATTDYCSTSAYVAHLRDQGRYPVDYRCR